MYKHLIFFYWLIINMFDSINQWNIGIDSPVSVRYEYRKKIIHREKMTLRRYVFAAIRRTLLTAGILTLLMLLLSSQDADNNVHQGLLLEVSDDFLYIFYKKIFHTRLGFRLTKKADQFWKNKYCKKATKQSFLL